MCLFILQQTTTKYTTVNHNVSHPVTYNAQFYIVHIVVFCLSIRKQHFDAALQHRTPRANTNMYLFKAYILIFTLLYKLLECTLSMNKFYSLTLKSLHLNILQKVLFKWCSPWFILFAPLKVCAYFGTLFWNVK